MLDSAESYIEWKDWRDDSFGSFIGWARDIGARVYGVEINATLIERACAFLGEGHASSPAAKDRIFRRQWLCSVFSPGVSSCRERLGSGMLSRNCS
jgi:hypothetical protein